MKTTYRMGTKTDRSALKRLWLEHSGWGELGEEFWELLLTDPVLGETPIVVAENAQGEIDGQILFLPSQVLVGNRCWRALRTFAPILRKSSRSGGTINPLNHPIIRMYRYAARELRSHGYGLLYSLPDPRWLSVLRKLPFFQVGTFPLWSRALPLNEPPTNSIDYGFSPLSEWGTKVDDLWSAAARHCDCLTVRDSRSLQRRIRLHGLTASRNVTVVEYKGCLVGLVITLKKGHRQWLIGDLLAVDDGEALRATLVAACKIAHAESVAASSQEPIDKVSILATPRLQPVLSQLRFVPDDYNFPFVVQVLDSGISKRDVAPSRWHVSALD